MSQKNRAIAKIDDLIKKFLDLGDLDYISKYERDYIVDRLVKRLQIYKLNVEKNSVSVQDALRDIAMSEKEYEKIRDNIKIKYEKEIERKKERVESEEKRKQQFEEEGSSGEETVDESEQQQQQQQKQEQEEESEEEVGENPNNPNPDPELSGEEPDPPNGGGGGRGGGQNPRQGGGQNINIPVQTSTYISQIMERMRKKGIDHELSRRFALHNQRNPNVREWEYNGVTRNEVERTQLRNSMDQILKEMDHEDQIDSYKKDIEQEEILKKNFKKRIGQLTSSMGPWNFSLPYSRTLLPENFEHNKKSKKVEPHETSLGFIHNRFGKLVGNVHVKNMDPQEPRFDKSTDPGIVHLPGYFLFFSHFCFFIFHFFIFYIFFYLMAVLNFFHFSFTKISEADNFDLAQRAWDIIEGEEHNNYLLFDINSDPVNNFDNEDEEYEDEEYEEEEEETENSDDSEEDYGAEDQFIY